MRSNYKKIGPYIREVVEKNSDLAVKLLLGVSVSKEFIPSIANIIGTDMSTYKIVRKNQFAYGPVTSRNSDKVSIAMLNVDECIVSTSYTVFEIIDHDTLLPEYLMMWFRRPEFDRYARFKSHGSVRELFDWEEMCDVELPMPSIEKQREIVKEYHTIVDRMKLNERLNQKLEETAQTIYKQWFVDFEFPISAEYAATIGKPEFEGQPYKSSGGEMVFNDVLKQEIPIKWEIAYIKDLLEKKGYIRGPFGSALLKEDMIGSGVPVYEQQHAIEDHRRFRYFVSPQKAKTLSRFSVKPNDSVISCSGTLAQVTLIRESDPIGIINQALLILRPNKDVISPKLFAAFLRSPRGYHALVTSAGGSAQVNMAKREIIEEIAFVFPEPKARLQISNILSVFEKSIYEINTEMNSLNNLKFVLLARIATESWQ